MPATRQRVDFPAVLCAVISAYLNHRPVSPLREGGARSSRPGERLSQSRPLAWALVLHTSAPFTPWRAISWDTHEAEDATQEAMLKALRNVDQCRGDDARPWLLAIVRNTCHTLLRRRGGGRGDVSFDEDLHTVEDEARRPDTALIRAADAEAVRRALDGLPLDFREVVVLRGCTAFPIGRSPRWRRCRSGR
jgi:RNA polymerase sigma-70 factor (ECF subfamily)